MLRKKRNNILSKILTLDARTLGVCENTEQNREQLLHLRAELKRWFSDNGGIEILSGGHYVTETEHGGSYPYVSAGTSVWKLLVDIYHINHCTATIKGLDLNYPYGGAQHREDRRFEIRLFGTEHAVHALELKLRTYLTEKQSDV